MWLLRHSPQATTGITHVLVTAHDLGHMRLETAMRDLHAATHLLDVYSNKRVDKRKVGARVHGLC